MKFAAKKAPTRPGYYLINTVGDIFTSPILIYCDDGHYTYGGPKNIANSEKSIPLGNLIDSGFWRFWGPINPIEAVA